MRDQRQVERAESFALVSGKLADLEEITRELQAERGLAYKDFLGKLMEARVWLTLYAEEYRLQDSGSA